MFGYEWTFACIFVHVCLRAHLCLGGCGFGIVHKFFVEFPVFWIRLGCVVVCLLCRCRNVTPLV